MRITTTSFALIGVLAASAALAQVVPPPTPGTGPAAGLPAAPLPPPPGAHVIIDRAANGIVHVDVHCAQQDTTKDCADIATRLLAATSAGQPAR